MRVHALAKEYGIKSTEFVDIIQGFGIGVKSHLSVIDDAQDTWDNDNVDGETSAEKITRLGAKPADITLP